MEWRIKAFKCESCGSTDLYEENGYCICNYCGTKHIITVDDKIISQTSIELQDDVQQLLEKCKTEPARAKKYAQRILEIDPNNLEAYAILAAEIQKQNTPTKNGCYVATAIYGSYDCPPVWTLWRYRDYTLTGTLYGRAFIHTYYAISPTIVKWFGETQWFKNIWKSKLDRIVKELNEKGVADTPYQDMIW